MTDDIILQKVIESIGTIVLYKLPNLRREEIEAMLGLDLLRQTRVYQEAKEEGIEQGIEQGIERGKLQTKLEMVPLLLELGLSVQEVSVRLQFDEETVRKAAENQS